MSRPIITLLTDFGTQDYYVAAMKGVILGIDPQITIVDLSHEIAAQDVLSGALVLSQALRWFPPRTIHVAVVDPGVGTQRRIIAGNWGRQVVIAPDNGLTTLVQQEQPASHIYEVNNRQYWLAEVSETFHGRDIMAPTAAHLALGEDLSSVGPALAELQRLPLPEPRFDAQHLIGAVIHADRFGNLITNLTSGHLRDARVTEVRIGGHRIPFVAGSYAAVGRGRQLALLGSSGRLEIAINQGNARDTLEADIGDSVEVLLEPGRSIQQ